MRVKAIVADVDGTITDEMPVPTRTHALSIPAVQMIRSLGSLGIQVIISTGRGCQAVANLCDYIGSCGVWIAENGGVVGNGRYGELYVLGDKEKAKSGLDVLEESFKEKIEVLDYPTDYRLTEYVIKPTFDVDFANKILRKKGVNARVLDCVGIYNLIDADVNKGVGLRKAAEMLGIKPKDMVSFGDGGNDIDMFKASGYSIAVANAPEKVKKHADYVTRKSFGEGFCEGVTHIIKEFIT